MSSTGLSKKHRSRGHFIQWPSLAGDQCWPGIRNKSSLPVKAYSELYELIKRDNSLFDDDSGCTFSFQ